MHPTDCWEWVPTPQQKRAIELDLPSPRNLLDFANIATLDFIIEIKTYDLNYVISTILY
jgi:hypothetical protein